MNIYVKLALILGIIVALAGSVRWVMGEVEEGKQQAYEAGHKAALLEVAQRDNQQLVAAQNEIRQLRAIAAAQEAEHQQRLADMDKDATRRVSDAEKRKDAFVGAVVRGDIRLFDPGRKADAGCPGGGGGATGTVVAAGSMGDGAGGEELSPQFAGKLTGEAGRADKLVEKVSYLQGYAREALRVCNAEVVH